MDIKSKRHSSELIKKLNLNGVPEVLFKEYDEVKIGEFCDKYKDPIYILRDLSCPSGKYFICKSKDDCLMNAKNYDGEFSLAVSCGSYTGKILLGEILISNNRVVIGARNDKESHHRNIYDNPCINLDTDWNDKRLWKIDGVEKLFNYLASNKIYDTIVDFVVYDHEVGINNNDVLIVELRSKY